ncbi:MAG: squalene/phytoene synthase family protein [Alphaproteobacteria bacterium]
MTSDNNIQNQARIHDALRTIFAGYVPLKLRPDIYKLICINSEIASIREKVSEAPQGLTRLQFWLVQLAHIHHNEPTQTPEAAWLADFVTQQKISLDDLQKWILARQKEYEPLPIKDSQAWWKHAEDTGGLMAQFWLQLLDNKANDTQKNQAKKVGAIWASVGCLRAIAFHSYVRLTLLPKDMLYQQAIMLPDGWRPTSKDDISPIVAELAQQSQTRLNDAKAYKLPKSLKLHLTATDILLKHLKTCDYNPFTDTWPNIPNKLYWQILVKGLIGS